MTATIGQVSVDDLLAPLPEKTRLGGSGPFVINLAVSTAPIELPLESFDAGDAYVYRMQRSEDRRLRYRLRLGTFANEDDADAVLAKVRTIYPAALTATADADDLRAIAALQSRTGAQRARAAAKAAGRASAMNASAPPAPAVSAPPVPTPPAPSSPAPLTVVARPPEPMVLSLVEESVVPPKPAAPTSVFLSLLHDPRAAPPVLLDRIVAPARAATPTGAATPTLPMTPAPPAPKSNEAPANIAPDPKRPSLSVDSTQTVRALSQLELESGQASQWFVIQLSLSEQAFDSEAVPNLDIFSVYRLYSVAGIDQGRIMHALRLGFFAEGSAAAAVASYLSAYYDKPTVKRVSAAERERFVEQRFQPRKDVGATGKHAVIEITNERYVRAKRNTTN